MTRLRRLSEVTLRLASEENNAPLFTLIRSTLLATVCLHRSTTSNFPAPGAEGPQAAACSRITPSPSPSPFTPSSLPAGLPPHRALGRAAPIASSRRPVLTASNAAPSRPPEATSPFPTLMLLRACKPCFPTQTLLRFCRPWVSARSSHDRSFTHAASKSAGWPASPAGSGSRGSHLRRTAQHCTFLPLAECGLT